MTEEQAIQFVVTLAQAGTQAAAAKLLERSQTVVSERLKKSRKVLGDDRVMSLIRLHKKDDASLVNLMKPFIIGKPICGKCGGERKPLATTGELVCQPCSNLRNQAYKERHPDRIAKERAVYREANREELRRKHREYRIANPGKDAEYYQANASAIKEQAKRYRAENKDKISAQVRRRKESDPAFREAVRARLQAWKKRNPEKVNAETAKRYARKLRALPSWANLADIADIYAIAKQRTALTGTPWHVDHIVPLNSDLVCGLHCEANLQVIPALPNIIKGNNWWPDMPDAPDHAVAFHEQPSAYLGAFATPAGAVQWDADEILAAA